MTLRARPVARRPGRSGWDSGDRRNSLINAGFAAAIGISILILVGYAIWNWYDGHFGTAASVDGAAITRDDVRTRLAIEKFRIDYTDAQVGTLLAEGKISAAVASQQRQFLSQRREQLESLTLERLIDVQLQSKLATDAGISVGDPDVDAQLLKEATSVAQRHVWLIEVEPAKDPKTGEAGAKEKADAKAKADAALADLKAGKSWDDVAKTTSTATSAPQAGDVGWMPKDSGYDEKLMDAVFAAEQGKPTDVVLGDDGTYRIGRATEISPETVDAAFNTKLEVAGIKLADYRVAVRGDVVRQKLVDKVVADLSKPSLQRHVLQIKLTATVPAPDGVKVRHILYSPKNDPTAAKDLPETDPAWAAAKAEAEAAYQELLKDPSKFDELARTQSDEDGAAISGGKLPFYTATSPIEKPFADAIFKTGLKAGDLIAPFKTAFGWHVVQFMRPYGDGNQAWLDEIRTQANGGKDFATLARDQGEGDEQQKGGDIGWVAKGQFDTKLESPIFSSTIGGVTDVIDIENDGDYLFKVIAEETRPATPEQIDVFEQSGFTNWYSEKKAAAKIDRNTGTPSVAA